MINSELVMALLFLYCMYGSFIAGKVTIGIKLDRASKGEPVSQFALSLVSLITIIFWAPIILIGLGRPKQSSGDKGD